MNTNEVELAGELMGLILATRNELENLSKRVDDRLDYQISEITRLENNVESAVTTMIHELIEYLRHNEIQSLDEKEFAYRLRELLTKDPDLPFS